MKFTKWLFIQKEGAACGLVYGLLSIYASLGLATLPHVAVWQKVLVAPVWISSFIVPVDGGSMWLVTPLLIGALIGIGIDAVYRPGV